MMAAPTITIEEFGRRLRARDITAEQMTEECLRRIELGNPALNAFILVMADSARQQARQADRELAAGRDRGPLHGVPISIKDLIDVAGTPTTAASRVREGHVAAHDAPVIVALRDAGAVIVGKTNLHEFAFGTTNEESAFGPARNPYDVSAPTILRDVRDFDQIWASCDGLFEAMHDVRHELGKWAVFVA